MDHINWNTKCSTRYLQWWSTIHLQHIKRNKSWHSSYTKSYTVCPKSDHKNLWLWRKPATANLHRVAHYKTRESLAVFGFLSPNFVLAVQFRKFSIFTTSQKLTRPVRCRYGRRWIAPTSSQRTSGHWPPNSPDLNPLDYHVWGAMLQAFHKLQSKPKTVPELKVHCSRSGMTCHRQQSTKLSTTFATVWTRAFRPMVDILSILCELGVLSMA